MKLETLESIIKTLSEQDKVVNQLYKNKIDLLDFVDPYHAIIAKLITDEYGHEAYDWFSWFCFENDYGKKELGAWDQFGNKICQNVQELHKLMEEHKLGL